MRTFALVSLSVAFLLAGCGETATLPVERRHGPGAAPAAAEQDADPDRPHRAGQGLARRRHAGRRRTALAVSAFASGLDHPRWLYVLPNGDVLVAETNAPPRPDDGKGIKGWFMKHGA